MRLALLGGGTIARLVLDHVSRGALPGIEIVCVVGRGPGSRSAGLAREYGIPYAAGAKSLHAFRPQVVLEAASHDAVREELEALLAAGISVVVMSAGALVDDALRATAEAAADRSGALLYVPSGGIGALDSLKAACAAGVDEVSIAVAKPPAAWQGIAYVEALDLDLGQLTGPKVLFEGTAREGVPHFPLNVNIAAALSLAGIGFDRTRLKVVADPSLSRNTHVIDVSGTTGRFSITLENLPSPDNPKTAWLACYSALAALRQMTSRVRYGT
jgi:aspartate dehydrogenase